MAQPGSLSNRQLKVDVITCPSALLAPTSADAFHRPEMPMLPFPYLGMHGKGLGEL